MSSEWNLGQHGDYFEQRFLPDLADAFPGYELVWKKYVVPLTRRVEGGDIQLRQDVSEILVGMSMAHYSVYYHLGFSFELGAVVPATYFPAVFFHLSAATEMVEHFLFSVLLFASEEDHTVPSLVLCEVGELQKRVDEYLDESAKGESRYKMAFKEFVRVGKSVGIPVHSMDEAIESLGEIPAYSRLIDSYKEWRKISQIIRQYRNSFAHNPMIGRVVNASGELCVPRRESLKKYQSWTNLVYDRDPNDFIPLENCIRDLRSRLIEKTNQIWLEVDPVLDMLVAKRQSLYVSKNTFFSPMMFEPSGYPPAGQDSTFKAGSGLVFLDNRTLQSGTWMDFPGASGLSTKRPEQRA